MMKPLVKDASGTSPRVFTVGQAAERIEKSEIFVYRRVYEGNLKVLAGSKRILISEAELERFVRESVTYKPRARKAVLK